MWFYILSFINLPAGAVLCRTVLRVVYYCIQRWVGYLKKALIKVAHAVLPSIIPL